MNCLITGGAGFIGSHTADLLAWQGHKVRILDSLEPPVHPERKRPAYLSSAFEFVQGSVCDKNTLSGALSGIDIVFHLAAYQDYLTDFSKFAHVNDFGTALLYEVIINDRLPVRKVVVASSQAVYGEGKYECPQHGVQYPSPRPLSQLTRRDWEIKCPICQETMRSLPTDESVVNPNNQYAVSKYCQELYALKLGRRYDIPTVLLRYSITQGPRQSFFNAYSGILRTFSLQLLNGRSPTIYEDGQQLRDYVHVSDVARANLLVMEQDAANYRAFNVGGGAVATVLDYAQLLISLTHRSTEPTIGGQFRWGDVRHIRSDTSSLNSLGWKPAKSLEETATDYLGWVQSQPDAVDTSAHAAAVMRQMGVIRDSSPESS
ncbi:MAG: NAD-dependent epimerase/dehydratase family protein [Dehalococcoidia bacterium]|nr:NAD-dependent epimerase/dehydratase family protein [Dehalococcoidia bacterium]